MMVGGVATAAAIRTFPFRVFSFPKEIKLAEPLSMYSITYQNQFANVGTMYGISRNGVFEFGDDRRGWKKISQEIDIEEAKRMFPGQFHWQDKDRVRYSVLQPDGSVVDV